MRCKTAQVGCGYFSAGRIYDQSTVTSPEYLARAHMGRYPKALSALLFLEGASKANTPLG
jgi:hypothetical protein